MFGSMDSPVFKLISSESFRKVERVFEILLTASPTNLSKNSYSRFKDDKPSMRAFVGLLFTTDTVNTILDIVFLYRYVITNFGDLEYAGRANAQFATDPVLVSMIGYMTQLFFAWRVWKLSNARFAWIVPMAIVVIGALSFMASIGTTVGVVMVREFAQFQKFQVAVIVWLAGAAIADAIITVSLIVTLHKARTGFSQTDDIISKLIRGTLQTGLLTASFAVIDLIREYYDFQKESRWKRMKRLTFSVCALQSFWEAIPRCT